MGTLVMFGQEPVETSQNSANEQLQDCSKILDKAVSALRECKDLASSRLNELKASEVENAIAKREIKYFEELVVKLEKRITYLEKKKCSEFSIIKIGWFKIGHFRKC